MGKTDKWYNLRVPFGSQETLDGSVSLFRILPFDALLQMLCEEANYVVKTSKWEDVYENFILKESVLKGESVIDLRDWGNALYGQCWTRRLSSDAMWRIYSPDKKSVRIKTRLSKLQEMTRPGDGNTFVGRVRYFSQGDIERGIETLPALTDEKLKSLVIQSLFTKRNSFSHEAEYRVIYEADAKSDDLTSSALPFSIAPLDFIENIYFDPRADNSYVARCQNILTESFKYPKDRIHKSSLYSFNPQTIILK